MTWFSSAFSAIGQAASWTNKTIVQPTLIAAKPIVQQLASNIPVVGGVASALVGKLLPDAPVEVQEQAAQAVAEVALDTTPTSDWLAKLKAASAKKQLMAAGVPADQASSVGSVVHAVSQLKPGAAAAVMNEAHANLPAAPLQQGFTKDDIKTVVDAAVKGAKQGAIDGYLDGTEDGKATKKDAIDAQGSKILPFALGGLLLFVIFKQNK